MPAQHQLLEIRCNSHTRILWDCSWASQQTHVPKISPGIFWIGVHSGELRGMVHEGLQVSLKPMLDPGPKPTEVNIDNKTDFTGLWIRC